MSGSKRGGAFMVLLRARGLVGAIINRPLAFS